jgi:general L-amino acid transport system permease protein
MEQRISESSFSGGLLTRIRRRYFYSPLASALTLLIGAFLVWALWNLVDWGVVNAVWAPDAAACQKASGACWGFVAEKWRLIIFGRYPYDEQWRPAVATLLVIGALVVSAVPAMWRRPNSRRLLILWCAVIIAFFVLMLGGLFGLKPVGTDAWGGLPLTVVLTLIGMSASVPLGILLAIGRRSRMPLVSALSAGYIELVRGVPLITVLFVAAFVFPLLLPAGMRFDPFWRVAVAIVFFQAAYMAETLRGGLQTIPRGQFDAAASLGLTPAQSYRAVILPQALVAVIPAFVNSLLSCFMDTSLVTVVSMYDLTGSLRLALGDATWRVYFVEGYIFIALVYFTFSFVISRYSQWLERYALGDKHRAHAAR